MKARPFHLSGSMRGALRREYNLSNSELSRSPRWFDRKCGGLEAGQLAIHKYAMGPRTGIKTTNVNAYLKKSESWLVQIRTDIAIARNRDVRPISNQMFNGLSAQVWCSEEVEVRPNVLAYGRQVTGAVLATRITAYCKNRDRHRPAARAALC